MRFRGGPDPPVRDDPQKPEPTVDLTRKGFLGALGASLAASALPRSVQAQAPYRPAAVGSARRTLIRNVGVMTMNDRFDELVGMDVLLDAGRIAHIGKDLSISEAEIVDGTGQILMPGMSDGHRHNWESFDLGRLASSRSYDSPGYSRWKLKVMVSMTPEDHYLAAYYGGLLALDAGVTNIIDHAHGMYSGDTAVASAKGVQASGIGGWFAYQVAHTPSFGPGDTISFLKGEEERRAYLDEVHMQAAERMQREVFTDASANFQLGLAPSNGVWGAPMEQVRYEFERMRGLGVKLITQHNRRTPSPAGHYGHQASGVPDLKDAGLLGPDYHVSHATDLTADELAMLKDTGGMVTATTMLEAPYVTQVIDGVPRRAPVHGRAREAGVSVGIGIDAPNDATTDYFEHIRSARQALYLEPEGWGIAGRYKADEFLDFATRLGARSLRLGDVSGSIEVGKRADLVLLRTDRLGFPRVGGLAGRVFDYAAQSDIDSVWAAGRRVKAQGRLVGVDVARLEQTMAQVQDRIWRMAETVTLT
jgi:cytosine/adenosine deaminase-related metal-dependent hydrolase